jgi:hypothetical protein
MAKPEGERPHIERTSQQIKPKQTQPEREGQELSDDFIFDTPLPIRVRKREGRESTSPQEAAQPMSKRMAKRLARLNNRTALREPIVVGIMTEETKQEIQEKQRVKKTERTRTKEMKEQEEAIRKAEEAQNAQLLKASELKKRQETAERLQVVLLEVVAQKDYSSLQTSSHHESSIQDRPGQQRVAKESETGSHCRFCGGPAVPGDGACYTCRYGD